MATTDTNAEILSFLRERFNRVDEAMKRTNDELISQGRRLASIESRMTQQEKAVSHGFAELNDRLDIMQSQIDGINGRLARIENRLEITTAIAP